MAHCPDHARELTAAEGGRACPFCRGLLTAPGELEQLRPGAATVLETETRADALPFKKRRACPDCGATMTPLRIGRLEAWVEKCPACELLWVEQADLASLKLVTKSVARQDAWASMDQQERAEAARELADVPKPEQQASAGQTVQALFGLPVLTGLGGAQRTIATWACVAALALVFAAGLASPESFGFEALAWRQDRDSLFAAFRAVFAHDGWGHVAGNLFFTWLFGDAVERKSPRWLVPVMLFIGGGLTLLVDGAFTADSILIGGASGGVYGLMGLTLVLQRRAKWLVGLPSFTAVALPLPFVMVAYTVLDLAIASSGASGVAWVAHGVGLGLGVAGGVALETANRA